MTSWNPNDNGFADISSHDTFTNGVPFNTFKRLRDEDPCHWTGWSGGKGFWSITRYADIQEVNKIPKIFSSAQGIRMEDQSYEEYLARRTFQETDAPDHTQIRMKVAKAFSKPVMEKFSDQIREICVELLDRVLPMGNFDATKEIARQLPMRMLGQVAGLPNEDLEWLVSKGDELISNTDPEYTQHVLDKMTTDEFRLMPFNSPAGADLYVYARELMEKRAAQGAEPGILDMILAPNKDGKQISENEFGNFFCLLVAAGNDTTRFSIAAGLHALAEQPGLLEKLQQGGDIFSTMADEVIRWASPTMYFRRTLTEDYEMHGKTMRKGDKVLLWFVSANRDERSFDNPYVLDMARTPNRHMAFGQGGPHVCLGMWLARLEIQILFEETAKRVKKIEVDGDVEFLRSNFIGGLKKLPIKVTLHEGS
ncbi:cytochrome P450 [Amylibacter sp.]|jgi:cytochrome P450|nr:cytochrome P450 [Amylibacter sp.]|tara:strand:- start:20029 stop:21297 length:1269 start_codon:yes stop_codon:yes gene_type:complete